jgi:hypothetical protein
MLSSASQDAETVEMLVREQDLQVEEADKVALIILGHFSKKSF